MSDGYGEESGSNIPAWGHGYDFNYVPFWNNLLLFTGERTRSKTFENGLKNWLLARIFHKAGFAAQRRRLGPVRIYAGRRLWRLVIVVHYLFLRWHSPQR